MLSKIALRKRKLIIFTLGVAAIVVLIVTRLLLSNTINPNLSETSHHTNSQAEDGDQSESADQTDGEVDGQAKIQTGNTSLSQYEHSHILDEFAVSDIVNALPEGRHIEAIELHTGAKPYGVMLHGTDDLTSDKVKSLSEQLFRLVDDVEWIEVNSSQFHARVTRDGMQEFNAIN